MPEGNLQIATFGGGCFWCLDAVFSQVCGVKSVVSGYCGGHEGAPRYHEVCSGRTGHAEVVQIGFDPGLVHYELLLKFFSIHDFISLNRQGNDVGPQYRSVIFYHDVLQKECVIAMIQMLENENFCSSPVLTKICPEMSFYAAEDYHQNHFKRNPEQSYCQFVVAPKLAKFRRECRVLMHGN